MSYECRIERDSISEQGHRLTTMVVTYPRFVHSEFMTHRQFSRNAASSRAIPVEKMLKRVEEDPVYPVHWGKNQKGMQADEELSVIQQQEAKIMWNNARLHAIGCAHAMIMKGVHKQIVNRLLEPFSWITVVVTATEWSNFFAQRCHPDAQPELRKIAEMMSDARRESTPQCLLKGEWHLPFIQAQDWDDVMAGAQKIEPVRMAYMRQISVARCARVSYLTHDGVRNYNEDLKLFARLLDSGHWSPFEHVATPMNMVVAHEYQHNWSGNFRGWIQYRKEFAGECK